MSTKNIFEQISSYGLELGSATLYTTPKLIPQFIKHLFVDEIPSNFRKEEWILMILCCGDETRQDEIFNTLEKNTGVCGATWVPGEVDAMITTSSGMCDCGDPDSWDVSGFCKHHKGPSADPFEPIPEPLLDVLKPLFSSLVECLFELSKQLVSNKNDKNIQRKCNQLLEILDNYAKMSPAVKRCVHEGMEKEIENATILDSLVGMTTELPEVIEKQLSEFFTTLLPDQKFKQFFAKMFMKHYEKLVFHNERDLQILHISVQIFTVPPITRMLMKEDRMLEILAKILNKITKDTSTFDAKKKRYILNPQSKLMDDDSNILWHFLYDMEYIFYHSDVAHKFFTTPNLFNSWLRFLNAFSGCVTIEKVDSDDDSFTKTFPFEMRKFPRNNSLMINSFVSENKDKSNEEKKATIQSVIQQCIQSIMEFLQGETFEMKQSPNPRVSTIIKFNTVQGPITFHIPLHRFLAGILSVCISNFDFSLHELLNVNDLPKDFLHKLLEHPLRLSVLRSHVRARFWARNNMHIIEQLINYESNYAADYALNQDIFLSQVLAVLLGPEYFLTVALDRIQPENRKLFTMDYKLDEIDSALERDFLQYVLTIYNDRTYSGMSNEEIARKFIIHHLLCNGKDTYSNLQKSVPKRFQDDVDFNKVIISVADFQKSGSYFTPKKECWDELDWYFVNYTAREIEEVEELYRKEFKNSKFPVNCPKPPYGALKDLSLIVHSEFMHKLIFLVLCRSRKQLDEEKHCNDKLLNMCLHALIFALEGPAPATISQEKREVKKQEIKSLHDIYYPGSNILENIKYKIIVEGKEESILSLLLSFSTRKDVKDHLDCINRVLDKLVMVDKECMKIIEEYESTEKSKIDKEEERRKKLQKAKERQKALMEKFSKQQATFDESLFGEEEDETTPDQQKTEDICAFCRSTISPNGIQAMGMICHLSRSNALKVVTERNYIEAKRPNKETPKEITVDDIKVPKMEDEKAKYNHHKLFEDINYEEGVQINHCTHICHPDCFHAYFMSLLRQPYFKGSSVIRVDKMEALCPICGRLANALCPLIPKEKYDFFKHADGISKHDTKFNIDLLKSLNDFANSQTLEGNDSNNFGEFSIEENCSTFIQKCQTISLNSGLHISEEPNILYSMVAYSIGTHEVVLRNGELKINREIAFLKNLIATANAFHESSKKRRQAAKDELALIMQSILGKELYENFGDPIDSKEEGIKKMLNDDVSRERIGERPGTLNVVQNIIQAIFGRQATTQIVQRTQPGQTQQTQQPTQQTTQQAQQAQQAPQPTQQEAPQDMDIDEGEQEVFEFDLEEGDLMDIVDEFHEEIETIQPRVEEIRAEEVKKKSEKEVKTETKPKITAFLSNDLFSLFVRTVMLHKETLHWKNYHSLLYIFYVAHILQSYMTMNLRFKKQSFIGGNCEKLNKLMGKYLNEIRIKKILPIDIVDEQSFVRGLMLTFMRRIAIFTGLCFDIDIPSINNDDDNTQFAQLCSFLQLPNIENVLNEGNDIEYTYFEKWLNQFKVLIESNPKLMNELTPRFAKPIPYEFVKLPKTYQPIFLRYHNIKCTNCGKKLKLPAICLICGEVGYCGKCECEKQTQLMGRCSRHAAENYAGVGLMLIVPYSYTLLLRETRKTVLSSFYLDAYGEEDIGLKRGKDLYLDEKKYQELVPKFILNSFDQDTVLLNKSVAIYQYNL